MSKFKRIVNVGEGKDIVFTRIGKSKSLKMEFAWEKGSDNKSYIRANTGLDTLYLIAKNLVDFMNEVGLSVYDIPFYSKAYTEDISVFEEGVERTLSLRGDSLSFIAYTGDHNDDHYMILRPAGIREFVGLIMGYYIANDNDSLLSRLEKKLGKRRISDLRNITESISRLNELKTLYKSMFKVSRDALGDGYVEDLDNALGKVRDLNKDYIKLVIEIFVSHINGYSNSAVI